MKTIVIAILCAGTFVTVANAQQQASPEVQALYAKLGSEIDGGVKCTAAVIDLRQQVAKLQAELVQSKKVEPKKPDPKK